MDKVYSWFKSHVPLFLGMVMYGYEIETKENKIQNKDKIELQRIHASYIYPQSYMCAEIKNSCNKGTMIENSNDLIAFKATRRSR